MAIRFRFSQSLHDSSVSTTHEHVQSTQSHIERRLVVREAWREWVTIDPLNAVRLLRSSRIERETANAQ